MDALTSARGTNWFLPRTTILAEGRRVSAARRAVCISFWKTPCSVPVCASCQTSPDPSQPMTEDRVHKQTLLKNMAAQLLQSLHFGAPTFEAVEWAPSRAAFCPKGPNGQTSLQSKKCTEKSKCTRRLSLAKAAALLLLTESASTRWLEAAAETPYSQTQGKQTIVGLSKG
jgi:hypothetical protein